MSSTKVTKVSFLILSFWELEEIAQNRLNKFITYSIKLHIYFSQCGYPHKLVGSSLHRVNKCTQLEVLSNSQHPDSNKENQSLFCIIEFNLTNVPVQEWIREYGQFYIGVQVHVF